MPDDEKLELGEEAPAEEPVEETAAEIAVEQPAAETTTEDAPAEETPVQKKEKKNRKKNDGKKTVLTYLHDLVYLLAVVLILFLVFFRVVVVSGPSMNDTLQDGDYLLLLNSVFFKEYRSGDIVVASKDTFRDGEPIVKRVIATEGQTVDIDFDNGIVYVDGEALDEPYISTPTSLYEGLVFPVVVEDNHVFVMGDNRMNSKDSRSPEIGQIDIREILGKAVFLVFPGADADNTREFDRIGVIG